MLPACNMLRLYSLWMYSKNCFAWKQTYITIFIVVLIESLSIKKYKEEQTIEPTTNAVSFVFQTW